MGWLTAAIELLGIVVGYLFGKKQGQAAEREYQLNLKQSAPRIGTRVQFSQTSSPNATTQFLYALETTIYNDGSVVASKLTGKWRLSSPTYSFLDSEETIREDSLPASLPLELHHSLGYHQPGAWRKDGLVLKVDIDLVYSGLGENQETYHATYCFEQKSGRMIQE
ncbi:MAG TPA: hypothetical protein VFW94_16785 [Candidatus Acidoferrales bacterium]|nr:hypothetical protein [Candidatus Acidoferrales bacterium]